MNEKRHSLEVRPFYRTLFQFQKRGRLKLLTGVIVSQQVTRMDFTEDENGSVIKSWMEISFTYFPGQSLINNLFSTCFTINKIIQ